VFFERSSICKRKFLGDGSRERQGNVHLINRHKKVKINSMDYFLT